MLFQSSKVFFSEYQVLPFRKALHRFRGCFRQLYLKIKVKNKFSYFLRFEDRAYGASGATASALKSISKETNNLTQTHTLRNTQTHTHTHTHTHIYEYKRV